MRIAASRRIIKEFRSAALEIIQVSPWAPMSPSRRVELHPNLSRALVECGVRGLRRAHDWLYAYTAAAEYFSLTPRSKPRALDFDALQQFEWAASSMGNAGQLHGNESAFRECREHPGGDVPLRLEGLKHATFRTSAHAS
jgi:hypothetical protein